MIDFENLAPVYGKVLDLLAELSAFSDPPETLTEATISDLRFSLQLWEERISEACSRQRSAQGDTDNLLARTKTARRQP